jgi:hypothetical protein
MSYLSYSYLALLPAECRVSLPELAEDIRGIFQEDKRSTYVLATSEGVTLNIDDWSLRVCYNGFPYVKEESREMAKHIRGEPEQFDRVSKCRHRLETTGDLDPHMDYFNDVIYVLKLLESRYEVMIIDSQAGELL